MKAQRDAVYLFFCHLEWHKKGNLEAYHELVAALDDHDPDIRLVAESLLHLPSPHPQRQKQQSLMEHRDAQHGPRQGKADRRAS